MENRRFTLIQRFRNPAPGAVYTVFWCRQRDPTDHGAPTKLQHGPARGGRMSLCFAPQTAASIPYGKWISPAIAHSIDDEQPAEIFLQLKFTDAFVQNFDGVAV